MFCDLDPLKVCDNCGKCIKIDEFATIKIDELDGTKLEKSNKKAFNFEGKSFKTNKKLR